MRRLAALYKDLWTPPDLERNATFCDCLFLPGWLFFGLAMLTMQNPALSIALFTFAGWLIASGSIVQRFQRRLWPFNVQVLLAMKHKAEDTHRIARAIFKAEIQTDRPGFILGMFSLVLFVVVVLGLLIYAP